MSLMNNRAYGKRCCALAALLAVTIVCASAMPVGAQSKPAPKFTPPSDDQVAVAIRRGLDYVYAAQKPSGSWDTSFNQQQPSGVEALVVLAALQAGEKPDNKAVKAALDYINRAKPQTVYARSLRAMVYARLGHEYADRLAEDVTWLARQQTAGGGWGYGPGHPTMELRPTWVDNSNTQMAMLGLYEAAAVGAVVPDATWKKCRVFWTKAQNADGGWGYEPPGGTAQALKASSYGTMSAAGACCMMILDSQSPADSAAAKTDVDRLAKSAKWLTDNYTTDRIPLWVWGNYEGYMSYFYLWTLGRFTELAGARTIGAQDCSAQIAANLVAAQGADGGWGPADTGPKSDRPVCTSLAIMALVAGRSGIIINKFSLSGDDAPDRDAANLSRWLTAQLQMPMAWQLLAPDAKPAFVAEGRILYLTGRGKFQPPADPVAGAVRQFTADGGYVLAASSDKEYLAAMQAWLQQLLPEEKAQPAGDTSPIFTKKFQVAAQGRPEVVALGEPASARVWVVRTDSPGAWRADFKTATAGDFGIVGNMAVMALGDKQLPGRLIARYGPGGPAVSAGPKVDRWVSIARVKHGGDWSSYPGAFKRLGDVTAASLSIGVKEDGAVDLSADVPKTIALLWMTGSDGGKLDSAQGDRLKKYLQNGGCLVIDAATGKKEFFDSAVETVKGMFGDESVTAIGDDDPLLTGAFAGGMGCDVTSVTYTSAVTDLKKPVLWGVRIGGRLAVVLSPYGLTCPMEGLKMTDCRGLSTQDAKRVSANIVLHLISGGK